MNNNVEGLMGVSVEKIRELVDANTVVGTPIAMPDGVTLIPVSKVSYGFASGGSDLPSKSTAGLFGGGAGAGINITPVAFISIREGQVNILPVVSIGGWGADGFSQAAATESGRKLFVESTLQLMEANAFLGVDIDWEYPGSDVAGIAASPEDHLNFTLLMAALRQGLNELTRRDGKKRLLACALGASPSLVNHIDCQSIGALVDQVNLMTYDMYTPGVCAHHTALFQGHPEYPVCADTAVELYAKAGIPTEKMMIGCAMYGRVFTFDGSEALYSSSASNGSETIQYRQFLKDTDAILHFDEQAKAAYAVSKNKFITLDSVQSITCKRNYACDRGLMGLMCWEYGGDAEGVLLKAMHG